MAQLKTEKKAAKNALFFVPLFDIHEADSMNTAPLERSFIKALKRMYDYGGFYLQVNRAFAYCSTSRKLVSCDKKETIAFGVRKTLEEARKILGSKRVYELERLEENGIKEVVYNGRLQDIVAYDAETTRVFDDAVIPFLLKCRVKNLGHGSYIVGSDLTAEIIGIPNPEEGFSTVSEAVKYLTYNPQALGFKLIRRDYYSNGRYSKTDVLTVYYQGLVVTREWVQCCMKDARSRSLLQTTRSEHFVIGDGLILADPQFTVMRENAPKLWLK